MVSLPSGTGKDVRVAVFARDAQGREAKAADAEIVDAEDLMEEIKRQVVLTGLLPRRT